MKKRTMKLKGAQSSIDFYGTTKVSNLALSGRESLILTFRSAEKVVNKAIMHLATGSQEAKFAAQDLELLKPLLVRLWNVAQHNMELI